MSNFLQKPLLGTLPNLAHHQSVHVASEWLMNEGAGNRITNSQPGGNPGAMDTGVTWITNSRGSTLQYDGGGNASVSVPHGLASISETDDWTIKIVAELSAFTGNEVLFDADGSGINGLYFQYGSSSSAFWVNGGSGNFRTYTGLDFVADQVQDYTIRKMGAGNLGDFVLDGTLEGNFSGIISSTPVTDDLLIGAFEAGGFEFSHKINYMAVYTGRIPNEEIRHRVFNPYARFDTPFNAVLFGALSVGGLSRYHNLNGLGGQGQMTWNPLG